MNCEVGMEILQDNFKLSTLSDTHFFLGLEIPHNRENRTISLLQTAYVDKILH